MDDSFADLLKRATAATAEDRRLKESRKRLAAISMSGHPAASGESAALLADIRKLEEGRVWITHARVALFNTQMCLTCESKHEFFIGWMLEQRHISDKTARKLTRQQIGEGEKPLLLPERREDHLHPCEVCSNCVESVMAINRATGLATEEE